MRKLTQLFMLMLSLVCMAAAAQQNDGKVKGQLFRTAFYNVENLFDTIDDPQKDDAEFTPSGRIPWTSERYQVKLDRLSQVIAGLAGDKPAAIIGLCEVENEVVLEELVASPPILKYGYRVIHRESPDERGIDNALLYDPVQFQPVSAVAIPVDLSAYGGDHTRDILYVKGVPVRSKRDTIHIFVNHWPSRSEGREASEPKRMQAASVLKHAADSLMHNINEPLILIMGDFNDEPADRSLSEVLQAAAPETQPMQNKLYNLGFIPFLEGQGTLFWKDWDLFDQMIVNGNILLKSSGLGFGGTSQKIYNPDWLLYQGNDGTSRPNRTAAKEYYGGYSDHLPVCLDMIIRK